MSATTATTTLLTREEMDALVDGHYRAEENGDLAAIVAGFGPGAEHDAVGPPGGPLHGGERIGGPGVRQHGGKRIGEFYRPLLGKRRIGRFEPVRRRYGTDHVVDESVL